jgi:hypothetical protein
MVLLSKSINEELKAHRVWRLYIDASRRFFLNDVFRALVLKRIYCQNQLSFVFFRLVAIHLFAINFRFKSFLLMHSFEFYKIDDRLIVIKITSQIIE